MSHPEPAESAELREEIDRTREDLARTVDELSSRLDFKARARQNIQAAKQAVLSSAAKAKDSTPAPVARTIDQAGGEVRRGLTWAKPHRNQLLLGTLAALALVVGLRRAGDRS